MVTKPGLEVSRLFFCAPLPKECDRASCDRQLPSHKGGDRRATVFQRNHGQCPRDRAPTLQARSSSGTAKDSGRCHHRSRFCSSLFSARCDPRTLSVLHGCDSGGEKSLLSVNLLILQVPGQPSAQWPLFPQETDRPCVSAHVPRAGGEVARVPQTSRWPRATRAKTSPQSRALLRSQDTSSA